MGAMACSPSWDKEFFVLPEKKCLETVSTFQAPNNLNSFASKALKNPKKVLDGSKVLQHAVTVRSLSHCPDWDLTQRKAEFVWGIRMLLMAKIRCEVQYNHPAELYLLPLYPFCC